MSDARRGAGLPPGITRRDFVNTTLVGAGASLVASGCPATARTPGAEWTGPGGVGDYASANGNTGDIVTAAHRVRDRAYDGALAGVIETGEVYDFVVVGGGFGGLGALLEIKAQRPKGTALLLDNQEVIGGYAKANEFDVDGVRVAGAQASMNFVLPATDAERAASCWEELGLPRQFPFAEREGGDPAIRFQRSTSGTLYHGEQCATSGYHFGADGWVKDIWSDDLARAPMPEAWRRGMLTLRAVKRRGRPTDAEARRLDAITFADYGRELGIGADLLSYVTLGMCQTGPQISALAAMTLPGIDRYPDGSPGAALGERFISFPGGNATLARCLVKAVAPAGIGGPATLDAIATGPIDAAALDRANAAFRLRQGALAVRVGHEGDLAGAGSAAIVYEKGGRLYRVRAKAVVMAVGQWIAKRVIADLPAAHVAAMNRFLYAPMLVVNVALRHWRFLDRLGFSTARWFDGFGFYASIRQPMLVGEHPPSFGPDKPIVMTFYVPVQHPELPLEAQGRAGRLLMYATGYAEYEKLIVDQMTRLFAAAGFDARRDIAGIVLNRWGHAFVTPGPGFVHGTGGAPSPLATVAERFGRIGFGPNGTEDWTGAVRAGRRAVRDLAGALD